MSSGGNTHWCYQCRVPVRPQTRGMVCPNCSGGFVQELEEISNGYGNSYGYREGSSELMGIVEALESMMLRNNPGNRFGLMEAMDAFMNHRRTVGVGMGQERGPLLLFQGQMPGRIPSNETFEMFFNGSPGIGFSRGNNGNLFVGPGLQGLIEQFMSERRGPPPAPRSAIDAIPTVKITRGHLQSDSHCPVCKDQFGLGTQARQLPCNHIYHSDCIVPWLQQHNSCPVCRHVLGSVPSNRGQNPGGSSRSSSGRSESSDQNPRRNPLSFLWPFRSSNTSSNSREYSESSGHSNPRTTTRGENHEMGYSGWPFDY